MARRKDTEAQRAAKIAMGRRLAQLRQRAGNVSQAELAKRLESATGDSFSPKRIAAWESQDIERPGGIPVTLIAAVAQCLGVAASELTGSEEEVSAPNDYELALRRLERKINRWRIRELSVIPAEPLKAEIDSVISRHKDQAEGQTNQN